MNGLETKDEQDRCAIFDAVFQWGPMAVGELSELLSKGKETFGRRRISALISHEWFIVYYGMVYIANRNGTRRDSLPKVG